MFLYPALAAGFVFVGVPLLVHLINLLRHRRTQWAAMEFLLASYRKQRRWIVLRQLLLLLTRLAVAALLIAVLAGWVSGRGLIDVIGGQTTHHVIVLDDSYSMGQRIAGLGLADDQESGIESSPGHATAYDRALSSVATLVRRLANQDGVHQITVMRASRAAMMPESDSAAADSVADLAAQTITQDARQIERLMSTRASALRTDLVPAIDLASDLLEANPADSRRLYVISDFARRDWQSPRRLGVALEKASKAGAEIRMIDCVPVGSPPGSPASGNRNLAITDLSPDPDVWVAGVPVMMNVTVKNFSDSDATNVVLNASVVIYGDEVKVADPALTLSGSVQSLPAIMIESIPAGQQLTKSFQIYIDKQGTHVVRVELPDDALAIDNKRVCTIPLADAQRVLIVDGSTDDIGGYHASSVLDPGSQVRTGAIPEIQPPAMLRDATLQTLQRYRAIYLIDVPEIGERTAMILEQFVHQGGGLAWFLGDDISPESYNRLAVNGNRKLLPFQLDGVQAADESGAARGEEGTRPEQDHAVVFGKDADLLGPISRAGNGIFALVDLRRAWAPVEDAASIMDPNQSPLDIRVLLERADGSPLAVRHLLGRGRIVTVMTGLDGAWNNWPSDPSFVVFLLQTNAMLFSGGSPPTSRLIDEPAEISVPGDTYLPEVSLLPPASEPPRMTIDLQADDQSSAIVVSPAEIMIADQAGFDEMLTPGVIEWQRTLIDGQTRVLPMASVLRVGESDLAKVTHAEVLRDLPELGIEFLATEAWENDGSGGGMSTFLLVLLVLLLLLIALEQALAAWASYHVKSGRGDRASLSSQRGSFRGVGEDQTRAEPDGQTRPRSRGHRRGRSAPPRSHSGSIQSAAAGEVTQ